MGSGDGLGDSEGHNPRTRIQSTKQSAMAIMEHRGSLHSLLHVPLRDIVVELLYKWSLEKHGGGRG
eukprot:5177502-Amphidinium_carterae.1